MIRVRALGASEIRIGRKVITPTAEVVFALGLYLCLRAGERLAREEVCEVFWGEGREPQGRHSLRQMLYRLRQKGLTLDEEEEELYLDPARVETDLARALEEGWPADAEPEEIDLAATLVPGFTRPISARYQEWLDGVRGRLAAQHRRAALRQVAQARREGRWADLDRWALQVLRSDPLNEEATLARAESAAISGSKAVALEIIDSYMEELGDRASVIGLPASLLRRRIAERRPEWSGRGPREVPLVGRRELMARLTASVDAAGAGSGSSILLWGAPGIGKTRLAEEVCAYAQLEGFRVVRVRATDGSSARPMSMIFSLAPMLQELPGALGCDPTTHAILGQIVTSRLGASESTTLTLGDSLRSALVACLRDLLDAIGSECRATIVVDDLHNCDTASMEILGAVIPYAMRKVLWLGTSRNRPLSAGDGTLACFLSQLFVPPLGTEDTRALARFALPQRKRLGEMDLDRIAAAAGGNPLFVVELTAPDVVSTPGKLPTTLLQLMQDRLGSIDAPTVRLLRLAVLLGPHATITRLRSLSVTAIDLAEKLEALENQGLVRLGSNKAVELHECWHQAISDGMSPAARAAISLECASLLSSEATMSSESSWRAAILYQDAGDASSAVQLFRQCAEEMLSKGLPSEALPIVGRAVELADTPWEKVRGLAILARAQYATGQLAKLIETCRVALSIERVSWQAELVAYATILTLQTEALSKTHQDYEAGLNQLEILAADLTLDPHTRAFICFRALAIIYMNTSSPRAEHFYRQARELAEAHGASTVASLAELIYCAETGNRSEVQRLDEQLTRLERESLPLDVQCRALRCRTTAMRFIGALESAMHLGERCYELSRRGSLAEEVVCICEAMTFCALDRAAFSDAEVWMDRWLAVPDRPQYGLRSQSLVHARARLHAQQGRPALALEAYRTASKEIAGDRLGRRRGVDLATIAYSAAAAGDEELSRASLRELEALVLNDRASLQIDYIVEMMLRAWQELGDGDAAMGLGRRYVARRSEQFRTPVAPAYTLVRDLVNAISSSPAA